MRLDIGISEEGLINVSLNGEGIGLLKSLELKKSVEGSNWQTPEVTIVAFKYPGMNEELTEIRKGFKELPWVTFSEIDPT